MELSDKVAADRFLGKIEEIRSTTGKLTANVFYHDAPNVVISISRQIPEEMKNLCWLVSKKKEALKYNFCWINVSGRLMIRKGEGSKAIWIENETFLDKLRWKDLISLSNSRI